MSHHMLQGSTSPSKQIDWHPIQEIHYRKFMIYTICQTLAIGSAGLTHNRDMLKPMALKPSGLLSKVYSILLTLS